MCHTFCCWALYTPQIFLLNASSWKKTSQNRNVPSALFNDDLGNMPSVVVITSNDSEQQNMMLTCCKQMLGCLAGPVDSLYSWSFGWCETQLTEDCRTVTSLRWSSWTSQWRSPWSLVPTQIPVSLCPTYCIKQEILTSKNHKKRQIRKCVLCSFLLNMTSIDLENILAVIRMSVTLSNKLFHLIHVSLSSSLSLSPPTFIMSLYLSTTRAVMVQEEPGPISWSTWFSTRWLKVSVAPPSLPSRLSSLSVYVERCYHGNLLPPPACSIQIVCKLHRRKKCCYQN